MTATTHPTQNERLRDWLLSGRAITPLTAWQELGIYRLGARIWELKRAPYCLNITTELVDVSNRWGESVRVASYKITNYALDR